MPTALLLVDLQHDFLNRPGLLPALKDIAGPISNVLAFARASGMPVGHIHTRVAATGTDRMPHWQRAGLWECVAGTPGAEAPGEFAALESEAIFHKQFFSGFGNPALDAWLRSARVDELWLAGVYTHSCVRATVMDAYERGYQITVLEDGVASIDPLHARITRDYLQGRAARFASSADLLNMPPQEDVHCNPDQPGQVVARVPRSSPAGIHAAVSRAAVAAQQWRRRPMGLRQDIFRCFRDRLRSAGEPLVDLLVHELGKPRRDASDEMRRALGHLEAALALSNRETIEPGATVCYQPHGVAAIVTPWNNPVAIPVGKLAAALMLGNGVVWKPAFQAANISHHLLVLLRESGLPGDLVQLVDGGPVQVGELVAHPLVDAVSLTGSEQAGRAVAAICRSAGKPLQAELGGNNALLVLADADMERQAATWVRMAYGFAGQRCTAVRRFVVERAARERFEALFSSAMQDLQIGSPAHASCDVGPLICAAQLNRVAGAVAAALARGASVVARSGEDMMTGAGHYYPPTLLAGVPVDDPLVQEELFGPVAVLQVAEDFEHGVMLVNGVRQGLLAGIATGMEAKMAAFLEVADAGILIDGQGMRIHPAAPFGGRKASQIGPPEHGIWDREFFSRVQMRYRSEA